MPHVLMVLGTVAAGAVAACIGGHALYWGLRSRSWPAAPGSVVGAYEPALQSSEPGMPGFKIRFRFELNGRYYFGDRVQYGQSVIYTLPDSLRLPDGRRPEPGTPVEVFYDPNDPQRSVLLPGPNGTAIAFLLAGLAFIASAAAV